MGTSETSATDASLTLLLEELYTGTNALLPRDRNPRFNYLWHTAQAAANNAPSSESLRRGVNMPVKPRADALCAISASARVPRS